MRGQLVLACFALFAMANGQQKFVKGDRCEGLWCPGECCPDDSPYYYCCPLYCCPAELKVCCPDGIYCAASLEDCPLVIRKEKLAKMAVMKNCKGTMCPAGCCAEHNWFCCPDNMYCAATAVDCPYVGAENLIGK